MTEHAYLDLLREVTDYGVVRNAERTGVGTRALFGRQLRFDLREGFPLLTTKRVFFRGIAIELLWFLTGGTNVRFLRDRGVHIWDEWADAEGELGPVYGAQWRSWTGADGQTIDQIADVVDRIRRNPQCRRLIVSAWNVADVPRMALPPCHLLFQFFVADGRLSCSMYQRSADLFLGVPFNIASYALLTSMIAHVTGLRPYELVITFGDAHVYDNHHDVVNAQLRREPRPLPHLALERSVRDIDDFDISHIDVYDYAPHGRLVAPVAV